MPSEDWLSVLQFLDEPTVFNASRAWPRLRAIADANLDRLALRYIEFMDLECGRLDAPQCFIRYTKDSVRAPVQRTSRGLSCTYVRGTLARPPLNPVLVARFGLQVERSVTRNVKTNDAFIGTYDAAAV